MATAKVDFESIADAVKAYLQAKLNTKLAEIDAEKNDGITLATIPATAYFFDYLGSEEVNQPVFVLYGVSRMEPVSRSVQAVATRVTMQVAVVLTDSGNDREVLKRLLRYQRALREVFETGWNSVSGSLKFEVGSLAPYGLDLLNRGADDRIIGITLEYCLA